MPKNNINYENSVIYKISCKDETCKDVYVGQTTDIVRRKYGHKSDCKKKNMLLYQVIDENGGWDNWSMIEIEKINCNSRNEAAARERFWYQEMHSNLNSMVPNQTRNEWKKISNVCECGSRFTNPHKLQHLKTIIHKKYLESQAVSPVIQL